ncbi:MAG: hypothetical protein KF718_32555 [Polyangiaceae bacterium]|nr:hypothetical protein [Polyangiaceae bacterium]
MSSLGCGALGGLLALGCGTDEPWGAAAPDAAGPPPACDAPDTVCPASLPHVGGPCAVPERCDYERWAFECHAGHWVAFCGASGVECVPTLAESCSPVDAEPRAGGRVEVGPGSAAPFRPFAEGELISLTWGAQGAPMIPYRLRVVHPEPPSCARVTARIEVGTVTAPETVSNVRMRCGESLLVHEIFPGELASCSPEPLDVWLTVAVAGVAEQRRRLKVPWFDCE